MKKFKYTIFFLITFAITSCNTCVECRYTDAAGKESRMSEYCGKKNMTDRVVDRCEFLADSLGGTCSCN